MKHTSEGHEDFGDLTHSFRELQSVANLINERKRMAENFQKLVEIQQIIIGSDFTIIEPTRRFVREAVFVKISGGKQQERHFILFNDVLVYASKNFFKKGTLQFKGKIFLGQMGVNNVEDSLEIKNAFELARIDNNQKKKYMVCTTTVQEKRTWIEDLNRLIEENKGKINTANDHTEHDSAHDENKETESGGGVGQSLVSSDLLKQLTQERKLREEVEEQIQMWKEKYQKLEQELETLKLSLENERA